jgi:phosphatidylserine decarboxylase
MSTLPLKALSRVWGRFNEIDIPYYFRVPGFKLYSWIFGVKLVTTTLVTTLRADKSQSVRSLRA